MLTLNCEFLVLTDGMIERIRLHVFQHFLATVCFAVVV